jgi:hypothetical protein
LRQLVDALIVLTHASTLVTLGVFLVSLQTAPDQTMSASKKLLAKAEQEGKAMFFGIPDELIRNAITDGFKKACPGATIKYSAGWSGEQPTIGRFPIYAIPPNPCFALGAP